MSAYRIYFRTRGEISGGEDFEADDDISAVRIARVLHGTCSDVSDCFELWQGQRQILNDHQSHHQKIYLADLIEAHQQVVLDKEETISNSKWMIAKSRRLIASVGRFMSPAKKLDQCWTAAENRADISPREPGFEPTAVQRVIRTGRLVVDLNAQLAAIYDRPLQLTKKEYAVLELLSLRKGTIVSREMLLDRLYGGTNEPEMKIVDEFVSKLREKIAQANGGNHYIETVWERGFVLNDSPQLRSAASPRSGLTDIVSSTQRQN